MKTANLPDQEIPPCSGSGCGIAVSRSWWARNIIIGLVSMFFLVFGINALVTAYILQNPLEFIMYFFSSSLIILISIVGIIYPFFRIRAALKANKRDENDI